MIRTYQELIQFETLEERFNYLKLNGSIGVETFGFDRYLNQRLYRSLEWKRVRDEVIIRDGANDLGVDGYPVIYQGIVHHMNPVTIQRLNDRDPDIFNPNYLVLCTHATHNAIHFGDKSLLPKEPITRRPGDTCPWR